MKPFGFSLVKKDKDTAARAGFFKTAHSVIETPVFMPVGTAGTVKALSQKNLKDDLKTEIILANTYHLYLRPSLKVLLEAGGLHAFMGWGGSLLTDSGGYQVYSLASSRRITEEGVIFNSHIDGSKHFFKPKEVIEMQRIIGSDIMMAFDECTSYPCSFKEVKASMERTHHWFEQCVEQFEKTSPRYTKKDFLFPIVQGGMYGELREMSVEKMLTYQGEGYAIGGLSVGETDEERYKMVEIVVGKLPSNKARYLMGVGTPENLLEAIHLGIDFFDCIMPTRNGRNGMLFTTEGIINIRNKKWQKDFSPIDRGLDNEVSSFYSKAYLRHLVMSGEILASHIASMHNLHFYLWLMKRAREKIIEGDFLNWKKKWIKRIMKRN